MNLKRVTRKQLGDFPDKRLLVATERKNEPIFLITTAPPETDAVVRLEISFQKCVRVGVLRK